MADPVVESTRFNNWDEWLDTTRPDSAKRHTYHPTVQHGHDNGRGRQHINALFAQLGAWPSMPNIPAHRTSSVRTSSPR